MTRRSLLVGLVLAAPLPVWAQTPSPSPTPDEAIEEALQERGGSDTPAIFRYMIEESLQQKSGRETGKAWSSSLPVLGVDLALFGLLFYRKAWRR